MTDHSPVSSLVPVNLVRSGWYLCPVSVTKAVTGCSSCCRMPMYQSFQKYCQGLQNPHPRFESGCRLPKLQPVIAFSCDWARKMARFANRWRNCFFWHFCLGHDGIWNIYGAIGKATQRREFLDWYHLVENLGKVGGSQQR